jgi:hypothetical protein
MARIGKKTLLFAADPGWSALKEYPDLLDHVTVVEMQSLKHFKLFCEALSRRLPEYDEYDHIMVDPINKIVMEYIDFLQENYKPSTADSRVHWLPTNASNRDTPAFDTAGMGDYQAVRNWLRTPIYQLMRLPKMVTIVCHATEPGFTEAKGSSMRAALPGKCYELLAQEVDFIAFMEAKGKNITISLSPSEKEDAGSRVKALHGRKIQAGQFPAYIGQWSRGEEINVA